MKNCHVRLGADQHYHSVPYRYIGQKVLPQFTNRQVSVFTKTNSLPCIQETGVPTAIRHLKNTFPPPIST